MPTFPVYRHKVVTPFGETFISSKEPASGGSLEEWIKENQGTINARFSDKSGGQPVKVTEVYSVSGDGKETRL
ncbi:MAG: hypothetical protein WAT19_14435 [Ferruginibacter sp.]